ncbi:MAG: hypothetical protein LUC91_08115 [Prevotella sp.]|nr:hypothetical protein [Prevotella sp.]
MPTLINYGGEMIRINTAKNSIEYSTTGGRTWISRYSNSSVGTFSDLYPNGNELLACTSKGLYYSTTQGRTWVGRYTGSTIGTFIQLSYDGKHLLATTSKGLFYSATDGRTWVKR